MATIVDYRVAQVRAIVIKRSKPPPPPSPVHLAYVDWFSDFRSSAETTRGMYKVTCAPRGGERIASIVPVASIIRSIHRIPKFGMAVPREWTSSNVFECVQHSTLTHLPIDMHT